MKGEKGRDEGEGEDARKERGRKRKREGRRGRREEKRERNTERRHGRESVNTLYLLQGGAAGQPVAQGVRCAASEIAWGAQEGEEERKRRGTRGREG